MFCHTLVHTTYKYFLNSTIIIIAASIVALRGDFTAYMKQIYNRLFSTSVKQKTTPLFSSNYSFTCFSKLTRGLTHFNSPINRAARPNTTLTLFRNNRRLWINRAILSNKKNMSGFAQIVSERVFEKGERKFEFEK